MPMPQAANYTQRGCCTPARVHALIRAEVCYVDAELRHAFARRHGSAGALLRCRWRRCIRGDVMRERRARFAQRTRPEAGMRSAQRSTRPPPAFLPPSEVAKVVAGVWCGGRCACGAGECRRWFGNGTQSLNGHYYITTFTNIDTFLTSTLSTFSHSPASSLQSLQPTPPCGWCGAPPPCSMARLLWHVV